MMIVHIYDDAKNLSGALISKFKGHLRFNCDNFCKNLYFFVVFLCFLALFEQALAAIGKFLVIG